VPNVAHGSVRLALLEGHFQYQDGGLLDRSQLRFFTRESIGELLDAAELGVAEIYHQRLKIDAADVVFDREAVPAALIQKLERDPDAQAYKFVIKAIPLEAPGLREIQRRLRTQAHEIAQLRAADVEARELQSALAAITSREGHLRSSLIDTHEQLLQRDEELERLRELLPLRKIYDRLRRSPLGKVYRGLRRLRRLGAAVSRRGSEFRATLRKL